jgi:6-pyruvoyltetrahydropterin/6-carboxytetrahydropterin synthase
MFELSKQFYFDAAHTLKCEADRETNRRIHGHSYRAEVTLRGTRDPKTGMLVDLGVLQQELARVRDTLDHRFLDEVEGLGPAHMPVYKVSVGRDSNGDGCAYYGPDSQ